MTAWTETVALAGGGGGGWVTMAEREWL